MQNELPLGQQDRHFSTSRLPRTSKPVPPRIDTDHGPEEYQRLLDAKEKSDRKIAGILAAREAAKAIQGQINELRSKRAQIKGKSKTANDQRREIDLDIATLRAQKQAT